MDRRQFNYLIRQLENDAHLDARGYRRRVTRAQALGLFELIDRVRARLEGPPIREALIDADVNASMMQNLRLGILG